MSDGVLGASQRADTLLDAFLTWAPGDSGASTTGLGTPCEPTEPQGGQGTSDTVIERHDGDVEPEFEGGANVENEG